MAIACLGWGSLIWDPRELDVRREDWRVDGPSLPVEFSRLSGGGRVTLVVREDGPALPVLWCELPLSSVAAGAELLRKREGTNSKWIGRWPNDTGATHWHAATITGWAKGKNLDGVVWTALPPKWNDRDFDFPTLPQVVAYLRDLGPVAGAEALRYIREAPEEIQTPFRAALEQAVAEITAHAPL